MGAPLVPYAWRRLVASCALLLLLAAALHFLWQQQRDQVQAEGQRQAALRLFSFTDPNAITTLTLVRGDAPPFHIERYAPGEHAWTITSHRSVPAEASGVEAIVHAALALQPSERLKPGHSGDDAPDLRIFGLAPPQFTLALTGTWDAQPTPVTQILAIGKKNSFDGKLYVQRVGQSELALVAADFLYQVDRDLYKLRDKRAAIFAAEDVESITQAPTAFGPGYHIVRDAAGFALTTPMRARADSAEVEALLGVLAALRGKQVVAEDASTAHLSLFGLQRPRFDVLLQLRGNRCIRLFFGEIQLQGTTHAFVRQDVADGPVWEMGSDWPMQKLRQDAQALRDMGVLHVDADRVHRITLHRATQTLTFVREDDPARSGARWVASGQPEKKVHTSAVAALVQQVTHLKADAVVAESPTAARLKQCQLHRPTFEVDLMDRGEHLLASLSLGGPSAHGVYVVTDDKQRLDEISRAAHDTIAAPFATYFDTPTDP